MNIEVVRDFLNQVSEAQKDWLANALYYRELETIRRESPLLDPNKYETKEVVVYDNGEASAGQSATAASLPVSHGLDLQGGAAPDRLPRLIARVLTKVSMVSLSDDEDGDADAGNRNTVLPSGPLSDMRLDIPSIRQSIGFTKPFEEQFPDEIHTAISDFLSIGYGYVTQESIFDTPDWVADVGKFEGKTVLLKGFPMAEDVTFLKHPNYWQTVEEHGKVIEDGQCYWTALSLLLYGNAHAWLRVKAEHLSYLEKILMNPRHPRHEFYSRENKNMGQTYATGPAGPQSYWSGQVNLWERLQIPGCWANEDLCQLTADVYSVFLVLYKYDTSNAANPQWKGKVYDMKTFGAYNNRHIFLCFYLENHFQPMVPNEFYSSEFKLPRLTLSNTDKYQLVTRKRTRKPRDGPGHHLRAQPQIVPSLAWPSFEREHLARAAGYGPYVNKSLPKQQDPSHARRQEFQAPKPREEKEVQVVVEEEGEKKREVASLFACPESGVFTDVTRGVVSLVKTETSKGELSRAITQADTLKAREALRVLRHYVNKVRNATGIDPGHHPLPTSRSSLPEASYDPRDPKGKGKRLATDSPESSPSPHSKRVRTPSRDPHRSSSSSSNIISFTPINRRHRGPSTAAPQTHAAGPRGITLPDLAHSTAQGSHTAGNKTKKRKQPKDDDGEYHEEDDNDNDNNGNEVGINLNATFFRPATKTLLTRVRVARLKRWCLDLELAAGGDVATWRKERCVGALLDARVEVRMLRAAAAVDGSGVAGLVEEEVEDAGVEVVRVPPPPPVAGGGSGGGGSGQGQGQGQADGGDDGGDDDDKDGDE